MLIKNKRIPIKEIITIGCLPSFLKVFIYKLKGYKIGKKVKIGLGSVIIGKDVIIKDNVRIGFLSVFIVKDLKLDRFVNIGSLVYINTEKVELGEDTKIRENVYIAGLKTPDSKLIMGKRCSILQNSFLNDKIDVSAFMVWFVENYPVSVKVMKENPAYQNVFRY